MWAVGSRLFVPPSAPTVIFGVRKEYRLPLEKQVKQLLLLQCSPTTELEKP